MQNTLQGKVCLVTGATSGIGQATARGLARLGAQVVLVARDQARGEAVRAQIAAESGNPAVDLQIADLAAQAAIRALAMTVEESYPRLYALVNCAALWKAQRETSPDGLELMFATNHLAYFLLSHLLLDALGHGAPSCIFNVTAPATTHLNFDDLQGERRFSAVQAFGATKAANLLFTLALARRLESGQRGDIVVNAYHPGVTRSNLMRDAPGPMRLFGRVLNLFAATPEQAAAGLVAGIARRADGANGQFFHGDKPIPVPAYTRDVAVQERLWTESARLVRLPPGV